MKQKPVISVKNLDVTYFPGKENEIKALRNINLEINHGEFIIFFGPSGCGKSTLLYAIAGLERNVTGNLKVDDKSIESMKEKEIERHYQKTIGMIFQAFYLIPSISVFDNIMLPQVALKVPLRKRKKTAKDLMKYFGVYEQAKKLPTELSGGQQQRVAISRALINDPNIILADEPVGNLDSKSARDVLGLIRDLNIKKKKTVILVTHDPSHLSIADRVFNMKDGELVDIKVNENPRFLDEKKDLNEKSGKSSDAKQTIYKDAEKYNASGLLQQYQARQIVWEVLSGFSAEEAEHIEDYVSQSIIGKEDKKQMLKDYLDQDEKKGGVGLDKRSATKITRQVMSLTDNIKEFRGTYEKYGNSKKTTMFLRKKLSSITGVIFKTAALKVVDEIIADRIYGNTDQIGVYERLDMSIKKGGAGLDRRDARRVSRLFELFLLSVYGGQNKDTIKPKKNI